MTTRASVLLLGVCAAGACSGGRGSDADGSSDDSGCSDRDGDGFGVGADCEGPDCNDFIPEIHAGGECDAWCKAHDVTPGCPCEAAEPAPCYTAPPETRDVGACRSGITTCTDGLWGECSGQVTPADETCDDEDDDCDGDVDDGVLSECGTCGVCESNCSGPKCGGWGDLLPGVVETPEGWLTLDATGSSLHVIWPSSNREGDILRVNTETLAIEAAFWTGPNRRAERATASLDAPSRSAVDDFGNVIIANRAFGVQASMTKIAADPETCPDTNGNASVDTSTAWDDRLPFPSHESWEDECILWHTEVGGVDGIARAIAIHREAGLDDVEVERGWVGMFNEARFLQFDAETGELTGEEAPTPGCTPYGGAMDRDGWLWVTCVDVYAGRFDTAHPEDSFEILPIPGGGAELSAGHRMIVDENNAPWLSGTDVWRWNRKTDVFDAVGIGRSMVGNHASDGQGSVWVSNYAIGESVFRIRNDEDMDFHEVPTPGVATFGMAVDFDGHAWAFDYNAGIAALIDIETESTEVVLDDCGGAACLGLPYVRGDITGLQRMNALNPVGEWRKVIEGCEVGSTDWKRMLVEGHVPAQTRLLVSARTASDLTELATQPWVLAGEVFEARTEIDLDAASIEDDAVLEVQMLFRSEDRTLAPILRSVEVQWSCDSVID